MNVGLYEGVAGMRMNQAYQDLIAENLALQTVPGNKRSVPVFSTEPVKDNEKGAGILTESSRVTMNRVFDFSQGPLTESGNPLNLGIKGESFFLVKEKNGTTSFTRNGDFHLSPSGTVQTSDGAEVLGKSGGTISISAAAAASVSIAQDGSIKAGGAEVGKVGLVHFQTPSTELEPGPFGRFTSNTPGAVIQGPAPGDEVFQGKLEQSNANPVELMANMIQAMRLYEANQKAVQASDDNQGQLLNTLGSRSS